MIKKIFFYLFLFFCLTTHIQANNIAFINIETIMNKSIVGIDIKNKINLLQIDTNNLIDKNKEILRAKEASLINKKKLLSSEDFNSEVSNFKKEVEQFNLLRNKEFKNYENKRADYKIKLLNLIQPILTTYSKSKNISILIQKKNIILGSNELDITTDILKIVNQNIKEINLK